MTVKGNSIIRPGAGSDEVYLGQTEKEVRAFLGKPNHVIRKFHDSYFYIYKDRGIDLDFGARGARLKIIFFYRDGCEEHTGARVITDKGIRLSESRSKVLRVYGTPNDRHDSSLFHDGFYLREWFYYSDGIQFQFGPDNKVDIISISRKKTKT
jgi:outer membrane protein assembly factor BamE (lipoprotein component of BamABCDE complex)